MDAESTLQSPERARKQGKDVVPISEEKVADPSNVYQTNSSVNDKERKLFRFVEKKYSNDKKGFD